MVHIDYKTLKFNTGISCKADLWDEKKVRIKGKAKEVANDNLIIKTCLAQLNEIFVCSRLQNIRLTPELLKNEWKNPSRRIDFHAFFEEALTERKSDLAPGTYRSHKSFCKRLKEFKPFLAFSEINPELIDKFRRYLKNIRKNDINTIHTQMRIFRAYLNLAIRKGVIKENPFRMVKLKKAAVERLYLTTAELKKLWEIYQDNKLSETNQRVLRHFLFMCFTGIRISDLKRLAPESVIGGMLVFNVHKTRGLKKNLLKISLNSYARQLIADEPSGTGKLFDTISEQKMNVYIKGIAWASGIEKKITNHSGRHTFATLWLEQTSDLATLQELLGHSNIQETMIYTHITESGLKKQMKLFEEGLFK